MIGEDCLATYPHGTRRAFRACAFGDEWTFDVPRTFFGTPPSSGSVFQSMTRSITQDPSKLKVTDNNIDQKLTENSGSRAV